MEKKLSRTNLSDEVSTWLYTSIQNGRFKPGERLPSVEQLAAELNVGRSSVREALRTLQAKGVITVKHGKGSFITAPRLHLGSVLMSFSENIRRRGKVPGSVILKKDIVDPEDKVCEYLKLSPNEKVNYLYRLRLADNEPMALEISYTPYRLFHDLLEHTWTIETSLYQILNDQYSFQIAYASQVITSILLGENQSTLLHVEANTPGLSIVQIAYSVDHTPVEFSRDIYRGDRYQYDIILPSTRLA